MPHPLLDFATIVAGRKAAPAKTPDSAAARKARNRQLATEPAADLSDLIPENLRSKPTKADRRTRSTLIDPVYRDLDPGTVISVTLFWTRTRCHCGSEHTGPTYSGTSAFVKRKMRSHIEFTPLLSPHAHPAVPRTVEYTERTVNTCPECAAGHALQAQLPLSFSPIYQAEAEAQLAPRATYSYLHSPRHQFIAFRTDDSFAVWEEFDNESGLRVQQFITVSFLDFDELSARYPGIVEVHPYPRATDSLSRRRAEVPTLDPTNEE